MSDSRRRSKKSSRSKRKREFSSDSDGNKEASRGRSSSRHKKSKTNSRESDSRRRKSSHKESRPSYSRIKKSHQPNDIAEKIELNAVKNPSKSFNVSEQIEKIKQKIRDGKIPVGDNKTKSANPEINLKILTDRDSIEASNLPKSKISDPGTGDSPKNKKEVQAKRTSKDLGGNAYEKTLTKSTVFGRGKKRSIETQSNESFNEGESEKFDSDPFTNPQKKNTPLNSGFKLAFNAKPKSPRQNLFEIDKSDPKSMEENEVKKEVKKEVKNEVKKGVKKGVITENYQKTDSKKDSDSKLTFKIGKILIKKEQKLRDFAEVRENLLGFSVMLAEKLTREMLEKMDTEPSSMNLAQRFYDNPGEFKYIDVVKAQPKSGIYKVGIKNISKNQSLQQLGDYLNGVLRSKLMDDTVLIKDIVHHPTEAESVIIEVLSDAERDALMELDETFFNERKINSFSCDEDAYPQKAENGSEAQKIVRPISERASNWDRKPENSKKTEPNHWRISRDAIMKKRMDEEPCASGYPIVISNVPFRVPLVEVIKKIILHLDIKYADEVDYIEEVRALSEGTFIIRARNNVIFNGILNLKDQIYCENRIINIRPFIDDGSVNVDKLRVVDVGDFI